MSAASDRAQHIADVASTMDGPDIIPGGGGTGGGGIVPSGVPEEMDTVVFVGGQWVTHPMGYPVSDTP